MGTFFNAAMLQLSFLCQTEILIINQVSTIIDCKQPTHRQVSAHCFHICSWTWLFWESVLAKLTSLTTDKGQGDSAFSTLILGPQTYSE